MTRVLILDRGAAAARIAQTLREHGDVAIAVYDDSEINALHVRAAQEAYRFDLASLETGQPDFAGLREIAKRAKATAIHPGFGPLAASAALAEAVETTQLRWIGSTAATLTDLANSDAIATLADRAGLQVDSQQSKTRRIEVLLLVHPPTESTASTRSTASVGHANRVTVFGDYDTSIRRRAEPLIVQAPAPGIEPAVRERFYRAASEIGSEIGRHGLYRIAFGLTQSGAVTLLDVEPGLRGWHGAVEEAYGVNLALAQLRLGQNSGQPRDDFPPSDRPAAGDSAHPIPRRPAIAFQLVAEDAGRGFLPTSGLLRHVQMPGGPGIRLDAAATEGDWIRPDVVPELGTLIVTGADRRQVITRSRRMLREVSIDGVASVLPCLRAAIDALAASEEKPTGASWVDQDWLEREIMPAITPAPRVIPGAIPQLTRWPITVDGKNLTLGVPDGVSLLTGPGPLFAA